MAGKHLLQILTLGTLWWACAVPPARAEPSWECRSGVETNAWYCRAADATPPAAAAPVPAAQPSGPGTELDPTRLDAGLKWDYCGPPDHSWQPPPPPDPMAPIEIGADAAELFRTEDRALLRGNVVADRGTQHLEADTATYERGRGLVRAPGTALLAQPELRLLGRDAEVDLIHHQARMRQVHYRLVGTNARGTADTAFLEDADRSHYRNITYTTCPRGSDAWAVQAGQLDVDRREGRAVAHDARLRVAGVPVLYTPYLSLPLDDRRQSGFLLPSVGNSSRLGLDLQAPYYFNIAPQLDATLAPRLMSRRGLMLGGEFRYLTAQEQGRLHGEILPDDHARPGSSARGGLSFRQSGGFGPHWSTDVDFNLVSDSGYLEDFGGELRVTSSRQLERRGDLVYHGNGWSILGRLQGFQTVDRTIAPQDRPYDRLPQILFGTHIPGGQGLDFGLEAENVYFQHSDKVHGDRLALRPSVSLPLRRSYGHLIPRLTLNHAAYWLTDQAPDLASAPSSTIPTLSLDGGLMLERRISWFDRAATQTLEPRLYYLYTPYRNQDDLPVFDSAEIDFSFISLFRDNRFTGRDRIGDANQLTLGLTSRTLSDTSGRELLRASLGEILYFADRRVQLAGAAEEQSSSAMAGELAARLTSDWSGRASLLWDPHRGNAQLRKGTLGIHYRGPQRQLLNLSYRLNETDLTDDTTFEDTELSFRWPVSPRLELVGRWLYSLRYDQTMEAFGGLQYGSCCWRIRALVRNFVSSTDQEPNLSIMLQLELSGLGAFGNGIAEFLERGIYGYEVE